MSQIRIVCVDFQKDFSSPVGIAYKFRPCIDFIKNEFTPYIREHRLKVAEIVSDYRLPRPGDEFECCIPGTTGYESEIPQDVKYQPAWVKCLNSPAWTRVNAGQVDKEPGLPYPHPAAFTDWLHQTIGMPEEIDSVVLVGLTLDCCVLCTAQELSFRAYPVHFLIEGVDAFSGDQNEKAHLLKSPASNWGQAMSWRISKG